MFPEVVIVAVAPPEPVKDGGLTWQGGNSDGGIEIDAVTTQDSATVPAKPLAVTTVMVEDETPPGSTASGLNGVAVKVKSVCADAGNTNNPAKKHKTATLVRPPQIFLLVFDHSEFNMSRCGFKYLRFLGSQKSCPSLDPSSLCRRSSRLTGRASRILRRAPL